MNCQILLACLKAMYSLVGRISQVIVTSFLIRILVIMGEFLYWPGHAAQLLWRHHIGQMIQNTVVKVYNSFRALFSTKHKYFVSWNKKLQVSWYIVITATSKSKLSLHIVFCVTCICWPRSSYNDVYCHLFPLFLISQALLETLL